MPIRKRVEREAPCGCIFGCEFDSHDDAEYDRKHAKALAALRKAISAHKHKGKFPTFPTISLRS